MQIEHNGAFQSLDTPVTIRFAKLRPDARIPSKRDEDAGYDIYPCFDEDVFEIMPHESRMCPTGIASVIPKGYYMQIEERGSTGSIGLKRSAGVMDSGYRGEWFIVLTNSTNKPIRISKDGHSGSYPYNKAIAQAILHWVPKSKVVEISVEELAEHTSARGTGMLGSSGK